MHLLLRSKQKIFVKFSKNISPEFAASVLETNVVATEDHDLDFSFCIVNQCTVQIFSKIQLFMLYWFPLHKFAVLSKQKILVKLSKYISPEFAASVLETNAVATEEHDLDFSFCLMTSLSMFQQLFSLRWLMQQQEKKVYHFVLVGSPGLHK